MYFYYKFIWFVGLVMQFPICSTVPDHSVIVTGTTTPPTFARKEGIKTSGETINKLNFSQLYFGISINHVSLDISE